MSTECMQSKRMRKIISNIISEQGEKVKRRNDVLYYKINSIKKEVLKTNKRLEKLDDRISDIKNYGYYSTKK